ncbi:MAG: hypothetical protein ACOCV1_06815 [Bacillota bacterium]
MKSESEIRNILNSPIKKIEAKLGIKIRNGQCSSGIKKALNWVLDNEYSNDSLVLTEIISRGLISEEDLLIVKGDLFENER